MKKKRMKKMISVCLSILLMGALVFPVASFGGQYQDVPQNAWYAEDVNYVQSQGIMSGTSETTFSPNMKMTRGMIVTVLHRMAGSPSLEGPWGYPYSDVNGAAYYAQAVYWARAEGIVSGYSASKFGPKDAITRQQLAAMLYQYSVYRGQMVPADGNLYHFNDAYQVSDWAWSSMRWAVGQNLINGDENGNLRPKAKATRAEVASILARYHKG